MTHRCRHHGNDWLACPQCDADYQRQHRESKAEVEVGAWWNSLSVECRVDIGSKLYGDPSDPEDVEYWREYWDWRLSWRHLSPAGQQLRIHDWYYENIKSKH